MFNAVLPLQVEITAIELYKRTLKSVVVAKACKLCILRNSQYKYLKTHFKKVEDYSDIQAEQLSDSINEGCRVFDNWERIVLNLAQCNNIDRRRLSVKQLYRAQELSWYRFRLWGSFKGV